MQLPYFYEPFISAMHSIVMLGEDTSKHCVQVLRMREGERMQLTDGKGSLCTAVILNADKKRCSVRVEEVSRQSDTIRPVSLAVSLVKNTARWEWLLEKAVEIGVRNIVPLLCERTEKQHFKTERMEGIVVSAMLQSRQVWLPELHAPVSFEEVVNSKGSFTQKLIAHCLEEGSKTELATLPATGAVQMLIGPEGDFTPREIEAALQQGYQPVSIGSTRLRTETAGVVASALLIQGAQ